MHFPIRIQDGKFFLKTVKTEKCNEVYSNFSSKVAQAPLFLTFDQSFMLSFMDPEQHSEKLLDPDSQKMHADPQPCL